MNKLDVAIRLLQLLNERKSVNSRIVADELQVSLRTAQRYLLELSVMPCVVNLDNNHTYSLNPNYKINEVLLNGNGHNQTDLQANSMQGGNTKQIMCIVCGEIIKAGNRMPRSCYGGIACSNNYAIDKLVSIIKKKLEGKRYGFSRNMHGWGQTGSGI